MHMLYVAAYFRIGSWSYSTSPGSAAVHQCTVYNRYSWSSIFVSCWIWNKILSGKTWSVQNLLARSYTVIEVHLSLFTQKFMYRGMYKTAIVTSLRLWVNIVLGLTSNVVENQLYHFCNCVITSVYYTVVSVYLNIVVLLQCDVNLLLMFRLD